MSIVLAQANWSKTFAGEDFSGEVLSSIEFESCTFTGCNFSDAVFDRCNFVDCEFIKCNLSMVNIRYSKFSDVVFRDSKAIGIDWTKMALPKIVFSAPINFFDCMLDDCSFDGMSLPDIAIESSVARRVGFRSGEFRNANFRDTNFSGALFSDTNLSGADFSSATDFDIDIFNNMLKQAKFDRFEAIRLLGSLDIELV
ncbi:pentapeptide repeat-containing protein [Pseudoalteromonas sp. SMS1]|uniref:pentapeptide repeat-containing protein n=1 Tax=Pseudoalteromonas sp. SMS1 TaxID=2908894 RepID=UPI001F200F8F|nr:pentapeptide repeat-containing protein [Pseudoalteromonas sp. SMS1]MCF2859139.1 pentapeptide repeat-containing protein [Pseudoalteromonas sp. SMS1]